MSIRNYVCVGLGIIAIGSIALYGSSCGPPPRRKGFVRKTCLDCHKEKKQEYSSRKYVHSPVAKEDCESCHRRHGLVGAVLLQDEE
ncbi:MAG: hypothetical protein GTO13_23355, partial [Proteobacteria bacterium]|nr:hypothetical protein [Pseudomonadota bacterium]